MVDMGAFDAGSVVATLKLNTQEFLSGINKSQQELADTAKSLDMVSQSLEKNVDVKFLDFAGQDEFDLLLQCVPV